MNMPCLKEILADNHPCDDRPQRPSNFILRRTFHKVAVYEGHKMKGGITGDGLGGDLKPQHWEEQGPHLLTPHHIAS